MAQSTVTVQILQQLLDETYNKEHNTNIRLKVMPNEQKLVLSNATNTNPDVVLCATAGQPFTFACRGALKNLLDYEDFMDVYTKDYQLESVFMALWIPETFSYCFIAKIFWNHYIWKCHRHGMT